VGPRSNFNSAKLDETQAETNSYEILTYQKKAGDLSFRHQSQSLQLDSVSAGRGWRSDFQWRGFTASTATFSQTASNSTPVTKLNDHHTIRSGAIFNEQYATVNTVTLVFPVDAAGNQTSTTPLRIVDNNNKYGYFYGFYLQDEWKPFEQLTITFGGRLDFENAFAKENQLSPRLNIVYKPWDLNDPSHRLRKILHYRRRSRPSRKARLPSLPGTTNAPRLTKTHR